MFDKCTPAKGLRFLSLLTVVALTQVTSTFADEDEVATNDMMSDFDVSVSDNDYFGWLPGETYNSRTGEFGYYSTDMRVEGNGSLDIVVNRKLSKVANQPLAGNALYPDLFGSMALDVPRIEFTNQGSIFVGQDVYLANQYNDPNDTDLTEDAGTDVCAGLHVYDPSDNQQGIYNLVSGITLHIDKKTVHFFPKTLDPSTTRFPAAADYISPDNWYVDCTGTGTTWKVYSPNGVVYTLDQYERRNTLTLKTAHSVSRLTNAIKNRVYVSTISDKRGNTLTYAYDTIEKKVPQSDGKKYAYLKMLKSINASDGRQVTINRQGDANKECPSLVDSIIYNNDNTKNVQYEYEEGDCAVDLLRVVRNDGSSFKFEYFNPLNDSNNPRGQHASWPQATPIPSDSEGRSTAHSLYALKSVTYPEGAKISYAYSHLNTCRHTEEISLYGSTETCRGYAALKKRSISGDALPDNMTWRFGYQLTGTEGSTSDPLVARTVVDGPIVNNIRNRQLFSYPVFEANTDPKLANQFSGKLRMHQVIEIKNSVLTTILYETLDLDDGVHPSDQKTVIQDTQYRYGFGQGVVDFSQLRAWGRNEVLPWQHLHYSRDRRLIEKTITQGGQTFKTEYAVFDKFNNPKRIGQYHNTIGRTLDLTYYNKVSPWIVGVVKIKKVDGEDAAIVSRTFNAQGEVATETHYGIKSTYKYHSTGDLYRVIDGRNIIVEEYNSYRLGIPRTLKQPFGTAGGMATKTRNVNSRGQITSETDWTNANATTFSYDPVLGRVNKVTPPLQTKITTSWPVWHVTGHSNYRKKTVLRGSDYSEVTEYDALGRPLREYTKDSSTDKHVLVYYKYAANGELAYRSLPTDLIRNVTGIVNGTVTAPVGIEYQYDAMGRITQEKNTADNSVTQRCYSRPHCQSIGFSVHGWVDHGVGTIDAAGYRHVVNYRSFGNPADRDIIDIVQQRDLNGGTSSGIRTTINRDRLGFITSVLQDGKTRTYTYKSGKRLLASVNHPETGTTTFDTYDAAGNLLLKKNDSGDATFYSYYNSGQLEYIDTTNSDVTYTYVENGDIDTIDTDGININNPHSSTLDYDYRADGLLNSETLTFDGETMALVYDYNGFGDLTKVTYPSNQAVSFSPNVFGQVESVTNYVDQMAYYPNGQLKNATYANGQTFTANQTPRQFPGKWTSKSGYNTAIDQTYAYDQRGNVTSLNDHVTPAYSLSNMTYDGLNRLKTVNGHWGDGEFSYHNNGDIEMLKLGNEELTYDYGHTYSPNRTGLLYTVTSTSGLKNYQFDYDMNGNVIDNSRFGFVYDDASRMTHADVNGRTYDFVYDGQGRRIRSIRQDTDTANNPIASTKVTEYFFYNKAGNLMFEKNKNTGQRKDHIYVNGKHLAYRSYHNDTRDSDGDGMPDYYEDLYGMATDHADGTLDSDGDGLSNMQEYQIGANPNSKDTDNDGMNDYLEDLFGLNIVLDDSGLNADGDGVTNLNEIIAGTNPNDALTQSRMLNALPSIHILFAP